MYNHNFYGVVFKGRWNLMFSERPKLENPKILKAYTSPDI